MESASKLNGKKNAKSGDPLLGQGGERQLIQKSCADARKKKTLIKKKEGQSASKTTGMRLKGKSTEIARER